MSIAAEYVKDETGEHASFPRAPHMAGGCVVGLWVLVDVWVKAYNCVCILEPVYVSPCLVGSGLHVGVEPSPSVSLG